jgi:hypothetical protein
MIKKIATAILTLSVLSSAAIGAEVYRSHSGQWTITGHRDSTDASCVLSTFWDNGARINVNIFPRYDGSQYTTMTIYNPHWSYLDIPINEPFDGEIVFIGRFGSVRLTTEFQIYGPQKVILRNLSREFSDYFIESRSMIIFPNTSDEMTVGLRGTRDASYYLTDCINRVL